MRPPVRNWFPTILSVRLASRSLSTISVQELRAVFKPGLLKLASFPFSSIVSS